MSSSRFEGENSRRGRILRRAFLLGLLALTAVAVPPARAESPPAPFGETSAQAVIVTGRGRFPLRIELADTPSARQQGLQGRKHLAGDTGMLFDFGRAQTVTMWMKDTSISLDMIFLDSAGTVLAIAERTEPFSTRTIQIDQPVRFVLEVSAGTTDSLDLHEGDYVCHERFTRAHC